MHWSLLVLKTGGQASTEVGIFIHITVSKTVFFIPSDGLRRYSEATRIVACTSLPQSIRVSLYHPSISSPDDDAEG